MQEGCYYTLVWVSAYLVVVGDSADPHQHEHDLLPEAFQDGICKEEALLDRSREAHARCSAALR